MPALRLPSPWVSALLVLGFLGFGVLMGNAASSGVRDTLAASHPEQVRVIAKVPATGGSASEGSTSSSQGSSEDAGNRRHEHA